jgi:hypothetical protein
MARRADMIAGDFTLLRHGAQLAMKRQGWMDSDPNLRARRARKNGGRRGETCTQP